MRLVEVVDRRIAQLVSKIDHHSPEDIAVMLQELCDAAVDLVPGAEHGAITVIADQRLQTMAAVGKYAAVLDEVQRRHAQGPVWDAARERCLVLVEDLATDIRWPAYQREALSGISIRCQMALPMLTDGHLLGVCSLYATQPRAFDTAAADCARVFNVHAALAWNTLRRKGQVQAALASRDVIAQAKGLVMERFNIDAEDAFALIKRLSQQSNRPLVEIARRLVHFHHPEGAPQAEGQAVIRRSRESVREATRC